MAITFEEEKKKLNWTAIISIIMVLGIVATAVTYLFFINPPMANVLFPQKLQMISQVSQSNFDFQGAMNNPALSNLKQLVQFQSAASDQVGKPNPFQ